MKERSARRPAGIAALCLAILLAPWPPPAAAQDPDPAVKVLMAARGLFNRNRYADAAGEYESFLKTYPQHAQVLSGRYGLGLCRYRMREYPAAEAQMAEVVKDAKFDNRADALAVLGHAQLLQGKHAEALATCDDLLAKHPASDKADFAAALRPQALYALGKKDETLKACEEFLAKYPKSTYRIGVSYFQALTLEGMGKHPEAGEIAAKLVAEAANTPYDHPAMLLLGQCLEAQGKLKEAADQYRKFVAAAPPAEQAKGQYSLGMALARDNQHAEAAKTLAAMLAKYPKDPLAAPARLQLGLAQLDAGSAAEARKTLAAVAAEDAERANAAKYWLARCDMADKKYAPARAALEALAQVKPPLPNLEAVRFDAATCAANLDQHDAAAKEFAAFIAEFPQSDLLADATYQQAFSLYRLGKYPESLELAKKAAGLNAKHLAKPLAELTAEDLLMMGKHAEAAAAFAEYGKLAATDDEKLQVAFRLGQCAYLANDFAKAIEVLTPVAANPKTAKDERLVEAIFLLGDAQLLSKKPAEAAKTLAAYVAATNKRPGEGRYKLALAQLGSDQAAEAEKNLRAVIDAKGDAQWISAAGLELGNLLYKQGKGDAAGPVLTAVLAANPAKDVAAPAAYLLAFVDFDAKKYPEAAKRFAEVAAKYPDHALAADAAFQQASAVFQAGQAEEALKLLEAYTKANPAGKNAADAKRMIASCLARLGRSAEAATAFAALAADDKTADEAVLYELAGAQRDAKAADEAVKTYRQLIEKFPKGKLATPARVELAGVLLEKKEYAEAAALLEAVVADAAADKTTLAAAQYNLGLCHHGLKDNLKASAAFDAYVAKYADDKLAPSAMYFAGEAFTELKKYPDAERHFAALLAKHPEHDLAVTAGLRLGQVQAEQNEFAKSAATYEAFLKKYPKDKFAHLAMYGMGWALQNQNQHVPARGWYEKVIAATNDETAAKAQFQIGQTFFAQGQYDQAVKELLKVADVYAYPRWQALALLEAGKASEQLKKPAEAKASYTECVTKYKDEPAAKEAAERLKALP